MGVTSHDHFKVIVFTLPIARMECPILMDDRDADGIVGLLIPKPHLQIQNCSFHVGSRLPQRSCESTRPPVLPPGCPRWAGGGGLASLRD